MSEIITLNDIEDCDECPLLSEGICCGGWKSGAGGEPIEPPCTSIESDKDLYEYIEEYNASIADYEDYLDRLEKEEQEKKRKAKIKTERRHYSDIYCFSERKEVERLKKAIRQREEIINFANSMAIAFNITNEAFGYSQRQEVNPELQKEIDTLRNQLVEAEKSLKNKRKECKKTQKYMEIGEKTK